MPAHELTPPPLSAVVQPEQPNFETLLRQQEDATADGKGQIQSPVGPGIDFQTGRGQGIGSSTGIQHAARKDDVIRVRSPNVSRGRGRGRGRAQGQIRPGSLSIVDPVTAVGEVQSQPQPQSQSQSQSHHQHQQQQQQQHQRHISTSSSSSITSSLSRHHQPPVILQSQSQQQQQEAAAALPLLSHPHPQYHPHQNRNSTSNHSDSGSINDVADPIMQAVLQVEHPQTSHEDDQANSHYRALLQQQYDQMQLQRDQQQQVHQFGQKGDVNMNANVGMDMGVGGFDINSAGHHLRQQQQEQQRGDFGFVTHGPSMEQSGPIQPLHSTTPNNEILNNNTNAHTHNYHQFSHLSPRGAYQDVSANTSPYLSSHGSPYLPHDRERDHGHGKEDDFTLTDPSGSPFAVFADHNHSPVPGHRPVQNLGGLEEAFALGLPLFNQHPTLTGGPMMHQHHSQQGEEGGELSVQRSQAQVQSHPQAHTGAHHPLALHGQYNPHLYPDVPITASTSALSDEPQSYTNIGHYSAYDPYDVPAATSQPRSITNSVSASASASQTHFVNMDLHHAPQPQFASRMASQSSDISMSSTQPPSRQESLTQKWLNLDPSVVLPSFQTHNGRQMSGPMPPFPTESSGISHGPFPSHTTHPRPSSIGQVGPSPPPIPSIPFLQRLRGHSPSGPDSPVKSQSPPLLIIPDSSAAPPSSSRSQLGSDGNTNASGDGNVDGQQRNTGGHFNQNIPQSNLLGIPSGGNLTGGPNYLSPIGPGGPSINIVPSTPTSGLKESRGIWELMVTQAQQAQAKVAAHGRNRSLQDFHTRRTGMDEDTQMAQVRLGMEMEMEMGQRQGIGFGPRRASYSGGVPPQGSELQQEVFATNPNQIQRQSIAQHPAVPSTAPLPGIFPASGPRQHALRAPPQRQRSRSESALEPFLWNVSPEDLQNFINNAQMITNDFQLESQGAVDPKNVAMSTSTIDSRSPSPSPELWQQSMMQQQQQQLQHYGAGMVPSTAPLDGSFVLAGPEAYGANFIIGNDGQKIPFGPQMGDQDSGRLSNPSLGPILPRDDFLSVATVPQHRRSRSLQDTELFAHKQSLTEGNMSVFVENQR